MIARNWTLLLAASAMAAVSCADDTPELSLTTWRIEPTPVFSAGDADDPALGLNGVIGVVQLSDGAIVVADRGSSTLRFYDAEGLAMRSVGREGEGPGEFREIGWLGRSVRDSLYVWDWGVRRVSVFGPDGAFARRIDAQVSPDGSSRLVPAGVLSSGRLVGRRSISVRVPFPGPEGGVAADSVAFGMMDGDGTWRWSTPPRAESEVFGMFAPTGRGRALVPVYRPFAARLAWATAADTLIVADAERGRLEWIGPDGVTLRDLDLALARQLVAVSARDAYRDAASRAVQEFAGTARVQADAALVAALAAGMVPFPAQHAAFDHLVVSNRGEIWLQDANTDGAEEYRTDGRVGSRWWTVLTPSGERVARIELPAEFRLMSVTDDFAIGVWADDLGIEFVHSHRITRQE